MSILINYLYYCINIKTFLNLLEIQADVIDSFFYRIFCLLFVAIVEIRFHADLMKILAFAVVDTVVLVLVAICLLTFVSKRVLKILIKLLHPPPLPHKKIVHRGDKTRSG